MHKDWTLIRSQRDEKLKAALAVLERHRNQKDYKLKTTLSEAKAKEWADYAQDLRDITTQKGPGTIRWPDAPRD